ncbi:MAG: hypothetical protein MRERV_28c018 [Mycoplasmataceae bacterium RV_VA103A]|nr:MAG: hypothetical protein MRERV_28c018 [Mycoplasmataceae bacterium RV_VA103A]
MLVNFTPFKFKKRWHNNQDLPLPDGPAISINRLLAINWKTCLSLLRLRTFQVIQAHNFQQATNKKKTKKTKPYQKLRAISIFN